ncbi:MAG: hypothetical protein ACF8SC_00440 [Phycisphaerales bacterium JB037]
MTRRRLTPIALLAPLALLTACAGTSAPTIRVADAAIVDRSPAGVAVEFVLEADNPNDAPLPLRGVRYTLELEDGRRFEVRRLAETTLSKLGTQRIAIPVAIPMDATTPPRLAYSLRGSVEYLEPGAFNEILFDAGVNVPTASFRDRGTIQLSEAGGN